MRIRLHHPPAVSRSALRQLLLFLLKRTCRLNPSRSWEEISVSLFNRTAIRRINRQVFGPLADTDVITLAYRPMPGATDWIGEVFVNVDLAFERGPRYGGPARELALYLAHGCDHLADASDATPAERRRMRVRELRWLRQANKAGLIQPLLRSNSQCIQ